MRQYKFAMLGLVLAVSAPVLAQDDFGAVEERIRALAPNAGSIAISETPIEGILMVQVSGDIVYATSDGKYLIHRAVLDEVAEKTRAWDRESFTVGEFKDRTGLTRKLAIPVLEWLDSERVTVRSGNQRKILRRS